MPDDNNRISDVTLRDKVYIKLLNEMVTLHTHGNWKARLNIVPSIAFSIIFLAPKEATPMLIRSWLFKVVNMAMSTSLLRKRSK